ncbi:hypothetical protein CQ007_16430 [Pseudomonas sp. MYb185]|nr:hypothetical protein CQ007_16430 [Pseudomonas sp. MYb185]
MKRLYRSSLVAALIIFLGGNAAAADEGLVSARQSLADYGLARCLMAAWPETSVIRDDIAAASGALHHMGRGAHQIRQNEDTLEVTHDPYQVIDAFVRKAYAEHATLTKDERENVLLGCLAVYHLDEYRQLVSAQDEFIDR